MEPYVEQQAGTLNGDRHWVPETIAVVTVIQYVPGGAETKHLGVHRRTAHILLGGLGEDFRKDSEGAGRQDGRWEPFPALSLSSCEVLGKLLVSKWEQSSYWSIGFGTVPEKILGMWWPLLSELEGERALDKFGEYGQSWTWTAEEWRASTIASLISPKLFDAHLNNEHTEQLLPHRTQ